MAQSKKAKERERIRALLLSGGDDALPEGWNRGDDEGGDTDMEITFTPGLSESKGRGEGDETTLEKYQRKMKEKRKKRKEEMKDKVVSKGKEREVEDDFFEGEGEEDVVSDGDRHRAVNKGKRKKSSEKEAGEASGRGQEATTEETVQGDQEAKRLPPEIVRFEGLINGLGSH